MMKVAVVEDEIRLSDELTSFFQRYAGETGTEVTVTQFGTAEKLLNSDFDEFDVIMMDIELSGGINGFSAVKKLREKHNKSAIVFVTKLAQYAVKGYEVGAFDFIVKPVTYYNFALKMKRVSAYVKTMEKKKLMISSREGKKVIFISDLQYVEITKHTLVFHTVNGNTVASGTLKKVSENLAGFPFAFCNACYLVNLRYVTEVKGNYVVVGGDKLQISVPKHKDFMRELTAYLSMGS